MNKKKLFNIDVEKINEDRIIFEENCVVKIKKKIYHLISYFNPN